MNTDVWTRVRAARKAAGLTQRELAKVLGLTRAGFAFLDSRNPKNRSVPNINQLRKISDTTRVPLHLLVSDMTTTAEILRSVIPSSLGGKSAPESEQKPPALAPHSALAATNGDLTTEIADVLHDVTIALAKVFVLIEKIKRTQGS